MGCGDHWPKCFGSWLPSLEQPAVVIEWTHRVIAALLVATVAGLVLLAWSRRRAAGVRGRGGVLRPAMASLGIVILTALFGLVTVRLDNAPLATLGHLLLAMTLLAALAATTVRAGGLGGARAHAGHTSLRTVRGTRAAAALALITVLLGGLTAKVPGANIACQGFPLCSGSLLAHGGAQHVQWTHRVFAFLLFFHVLGLIMGVPKRRETPVVLRALRIGFGLLLLQLVIAAAMVELHLPPALRSIHQATGAAIWLALFTAAYLAERAESGKRKEERREERGKGKEERTSDKVSPRQGVSFLFPLSSFLSWCPL
jgi:heme A synthase